MASFYSTKDSRGYQLRLDVTQGTQSVVNNTSVVSWSLYLVVGSWSFNNYTLSDSLTWVDLESDGTKEWTWPTGSQFSCNGTNKTVLVSSGSKTIAHNADGSKSLTVSASFRTNSATTAYGPTAVLTLSGALVLTTIPRASQPTLSASSAALGEPVIITTNRATADFTHVLTYAIGTQTGAIASGVGASYSWTLPNEIANEIPTAKSGRVVITCKTYNGATLVGTKASSIIATVPNNSTFQPTPSITSITEAVTMPSGITVFVQGKSKLLVISSAVSKYPANNIAQYKVEVLGSSYYGTNVTTSLVMSSGTVPVKFTATDKRGYSGSVIQNVTVYAYSPPSIPTFSAARSPSSQDSNLFVSYGYSVSTTNNQNTLYFAVRYRLAGTSTWTNLATGASPYTLTTTYSGAGILLTDKSYEVGISVSDKWSIATMEVDIGTAFELMNINASGKGIAFGKVSTKDAFEVGMPFYANNHLQPLAYAREVTFSTAYVYAFSCSGDRLSSAVRFSVRGTSANVVVVALVEIIANHSNSILISGTQGNYTPLTVKAISDGKGSFDVFLKHSGPTSTPCLIEVIPVGGSVVSFSPLNVSAATKELTLTANGYSTTGVIFGGV